MSTFFGYSIQISIRINACSTKKETLFCQTKIENQSVPYDIWTLPLDFVILCISLIANNYYSKNNECNVKWHWNYLVAINQMIVRCNISLQRNYFDGLKFIASSGFVIATTYFATSYTTLQHVFLRFIQISCNYLYCIEEPNSDAVGCIAINLTPL